MSIVWRRLQSTTSLNLIFIPLLYFFPNHFPTTAAGREARESSTASQNSSPCRDTGDREVICLNLLLISAKLFQFLQWKREQNQAPKRRAISLFTFWHESTQQARREVSRALSWGCFPPTAADAKTPFSSQKNPQNCIRLILQQTLLFSQEP